MLQMLRIVSTVIAVYMVLILIRIMFTRFRGAASGKPWELLVQVTDPYLSLFSGLKFLKKGMFDFTPVAAILVLVVLFNLVNSILNYGKITLGLFLGSILGAVWSGLSFLIFLFLILAIIRAVILNIGRGSESSFGRMVSMMLQPAVSLVAKYFPLKKPGSESQYLYLTIALLFVIWILGGILARGLVSIFVALPI